MTKNPLINALSATLYIVLVASMMFYGVEKAGPVHSVIAPIAILSLFTLSAAVMGYLFFYQPVMLYLEGKKKDAVRLFLQTLAVFGVVTLLILTLLFTRVLS